MTVKVKISVEMEKTVKLDNDDLGVSYDEWKSMSSKEKKNAIIKAIDDLPEQPWWSVDSFDEE